MMQNAALLSYMNKCYKNATCNIPEHLVFVYCLDRWLMMLNRLHNLVNWDNSDKAVFRKSRYGDIYGFNYYIIPELAYGNQAS
jgi:hypothetical protein